MRCDPNVDCCSSRCSTRPGAKRRLEQANEDALLGSPPTLLPDLTAFPFTHLLPRPLLSGEPPGSPRAPPGSLQPLGLLESLSELGLQTGAGQEWACFLLLDTGRCCKVLAGLLDIRDPSGWTSLRGPSSWETSLGLSGLHPKAEPFPGASVLSFCAGAQSKRSA